MEPKNAITTFLVMLPAVIFWFWRVSPDYDHPWVLLVLMPLLLIICLILFVISLVFGLKKRVFRWWMSTVINATVIFASFFDFFRG